MNFFFFCFCKYFNYKKFLIFKINKFNIILGVLSNEWLHTSELLKYYVLPNGTVFQINDINDKIYFKNATLGPWFFCWLDRKIFINLLINFYL